MSKSKSLTDTEVLNFQELRSVISDEMEAVLGTVKSLKDRPPIIVFVTGASGFGKTHFSKLLFDEIVEKGIPDRVIRSESVRLIHGDNYGATVGDKWLVSAELAFRTVGVNPADIVIFEVAADNLGAVHEFLGSIGVVIPVVPVPTPNVFREAMRLKAAEYEKNSERPKQSWIDGWNAKSKFSDAEVLSYVAEKVKHFRKFYPNLRLVSAPVSGAVTTGWAKAKAWHPEVTQTVVANFLNSKTNFQTK